MPTLRGEGNLGGQREHGSWQQRADIDHDVAQRGPSIETNSIAHQVNWLDSFLVGVAETPAS